ncbi:MAG: hypothetical protein V1903_13935 [Bacteroidota bacterium]
MPTVVKLHHHHEHDFSNHETNRATDYFSHKCLICDFQFSAYSKEEFIPETALSDYGDFQANLYSHTQLSDNHKYSFLLRAPPVLHLV